MGEIINGIVYFDVEKNLVFGCLDFLKDEIIREINKTEKKIEASGFYSFSVFRSDEYSIIIINRHVDKAKLYLFNNGIELYFADENTFVSEFKDKFENYLLLDWR